MAQQVFIFDGFERDEEFKLDVKGAQKKDPHSGRYTKNENGKIRRYYIKRSMDYVADDISEVASSQILKTLVGEELAIPYEFIKGTNGIVYVKSEIRDNDVNFELVVAKKYHLSPIKIRTNPMTQHNKKRINKSMEKTQLESLAKILPACLFLRDYDVQTGNFVLYGKSPKKLAKFDNGWALAGICKDKSRRVDLFSARTLMGRSGTHRLGGIPTNHFKDYLVINTKEFVAGMKAVIDKGTRELYVEMEKAIDKIEEFYPEDKTRRVLLEFAKHIGLISKPTLAERLGLVKPKKRIDFEKIIKTREIKSVILRELKKKMEQRMHSMKVLKVFLEMNLELKEKAFSPAKLAGLIDELKKVIQKDFTEKNGYFSKEKLRDVLPKFKPPRAKLLKKILEAAKLQNVSQADIDFIENLKKLDTPLGDMQKRFEPKSEDSAHAQIVSRPVWSTSGMRSSSSSLLFDHPTAQPAATIASVVHEKLISQQWRDVKEFFKTRYKVEESKSFIQINDMQQQTKTKIENQINGVLQVSSAKKHPEQMTPIDYEDMALKFRQAATITNHTACVLEHVHERWILTTLVNCLLSEKGMYAGLPKVLPNLSPEQLPLLEKTALQRYMDAKKPGADQSSSIAPTP